ncbi:MAG: ABC transporter permease [Candidatus Hermodarchaeia archaeon]|jgi:ABC-type lipoprotein release transport system permease subunit
MHWKLALQHLARHWRLNLVLLIVVLLGASMLASLPMLAITIAGESFSQTLESTPVSERNIFIQGKMKHNELSKDVELALDDLLMDVIAVREGDARGYPIISKPDGSEQNLYPATLILNLRSFEPLEDRVRIIEGHLPKSNSGLSPENEQPILEAAIGKEAAQRMKLGVGDEIFSAGGRVHLRIVGIVEPLHPHSEIWWEDTQMMSFSAWRRISFLPDIDEWNLSLIVPPQTMVSEIYHKHFWRVILDYEKITVLNTPDVRETLIGLQSSLSEDNMILRTGLVDLIEQFADALALAQVSLLLLTLQSLFAVFFLLGMFGNFLVEQSRMEYSTLLGRGFSRGQIAGLFARSSILLALLAGFLAPWMARWVLVLWSKWQGSPAPDFIPVESWWLALSTGMFCWIFLVISIFRATKRILLPSQGVHFNGRTPSQRQPIWDIFILTLGGLAYWQLVQGSTITRDTNNISEGSIAGISDPILLLGPTLLMFAAGLIAVRLLPLLWRFFAWISLKTRGLLWTLGFTRLARQPIGPSQVTILISLTAGLMLFASVFTYSIENWQQAIARYIEGADIRVSQSFFEPFAWNELIDSPSTEEMTQVIRTKATFLVSENKRINVDLLAVDPATFSSVVSFPSGFSRHSMVKIMQILKPDSPNVLPIVISNNINPHQLTIGDQIVLEMGKATYPFEVVGIIANFPLVDDVFAITNLSRFAKQISLESIALTDQGTNEIWIKIDPSEHESVFARFVEAGLGDSVVANSKKRLEVFQNNLVFREVTTAFELNALVLIPLSGLGFFLMHFFSVQRRTAEFNILQALGLSKSQLRSQLMIEGFIFVALGLLVGAGIGFGLAIMMQPFVSQILPSLGGKFAFNHMLINWSYVGIQFLALIGFYGVGLLVLMIYAIRNLRSVQF